MVREIAKTWPHAELMDTWTWFQSGLNTDGAHNPVTSRKIERGDILSLNCFPMVAGYYVALERTLFAETATDENIRLWQINCDVHDRGKELLVPGNSCADIAKELNAMYAEKNLLQYRQLRLPLPPSASSATTTAARPASSSARTARPCWSPAWSSRWSR